MSLSCLKSLMISTSSSVKTKIPTKAPLTWPGLPLELHLLTLLAFLCTSPSPPPLPFQLAKFYSPFQGSLRVFCLFQRSLRPGAMALLEAPLAPCPSTHVTSFLLGFFQLPVIWPFTSHLCLCSLVYKWKS